MPGRIFIHKKKDSEKKEEEEEEEKFDEYGVPLNEGLDYSILSINLDEVDDETLILRQIREGIQDRLSPCIYYFNFSLDEE